MTLEIVDGCDIAYPSEKYTITGVPFCFNDALTDGRQQGLNTIFACFLGSENVSWASKVTDNVISVRYGRARVKAFTHRALTLHNALVCKNHSSKTLHLSLFCIKNRADLWCKRGLKLMQLGLFCMLTGALKGGKGVNIGDYWWFINRKKETGCYCFSYFAIFICNNSAKSKIYLRVLNHDSPELNSGVFD